MAFNGYKFRRHYYPILYTIAGKSYRISAGFLKKMPGKKPGIGKKRGIGFYNFVVFNLKLLLTTETELNAIAAPAIMGSNKNPLTGYNKPAAIGIPMRL